MTNYSSLRRHTTRLKHYNYTSAGYYFITICTHEKRCLFGGIEHGEMVLSDMGEIAERELLKTAEIRENVAIDSYVIMPNHIHVIVVITESMSQSHTTRQETTRQRHVATGTNVATPRCGVESQMTGIQNITAPRCGVE